MQIDDRALEAARKAVKGYAIGYPMQDISTCADVAIRAYLEATTPPDAAELIRRLEGYVECCPPGFEKQHHADMLRAATALRLSAGGWRQMDSAPQGPAILLDLGETIPDLVDARVGQYITEADAAELGETLPASGGWIIWNSGDDWFVVPFDNAHGWQPLPASPTVEAGHVE